MHIRLGLCIGIGFAPESRVREITNNQNVISLGKDVWMFSINQLSKSRANTMFRKTPDLSQIAKESVRRWRVVLEQNPADLDAALNLYAACIESGDESLVSGIEKELQQSYPSEEKILKSIARHCLSSGRVDEAKQRWTEILQSNVGDTEALNALGYVHLKLNEPETTLEMADKLSALKDAEKMSEKLRIHAFFNMKRWEESIAHCEKLVSLDTSDKESITFLITANFKCKNYEAAHQLLEKTFSKEETDPKVLLTKQQLLMKMEDWDNSLIANEFLLRLNKDDESTLYDRAIILLKLGRLDESDQICTKILSKNPQNLKFTTLSAQVGQAFVASLKAA